MVTEDPMTDKAEKKQGSGKLAPHVATPPPPLPNGPPPLEVQRGHISGCPQSRGVGVDVGTKQCPRGIQHRRVEHGDGDLFRRDERGNCPKQNVQRQQVGYLRGGHRHSQHREQQFVRQCGRPSAVRHTIDVRPDGLLSRQSKIGQRPIEQVKVREAGATAAGTWPSTPRTIFLGVASRQPLSPRGWQSLCSRTDLMVCSSEEGATELGDIRATAGSRLSPLQSPSSRSC